MRNVKREKSLSAIVYERTEGTDKMQTMTISADSNHSEETTEVNNNSNNVSFSHLYNLILNQKILDVTRSFVLHWSIVIN